VRRNMFTLMLIMSMGPMGAMAATPDHFRVRSTADLIEICSTPANDSMYPAALSFCHGFAVGAYQYYRASVSGPEGKPFVCLPDPPPSRTEGLQMFVAWARENSQHMGEPAVETLFRWMATTWPCRK
jgi:Ssp1 endopeptidase immunity protein Rap1a